MKTIVFLLSFIPFISIELNAQQNDSMVSGKDSVSPVISEILGFDSIYYPPCILPLEPEAKTPVLSYKWVNFDSGCHAKGAKRDLKNGKAIIWFPGGIFGCNFSSKADQEFQNRYQVQFISPGCCRWGDEDPEGYNEVIFQHLDKKYGTGWRDELRPDATGFTPPKTNNTASKLSLNSPLAMQLANPGEIGSEPLNPETETSVWWYVLPTSGFALLLSLYFIKKRKN